MSRTTFVRRLTAALALWAVLCLAVPATAATPGSHLPKSPTISHSLVDQFLAWLAGMGWGPAPAARPQAGSLSKSTSVTVPPAGFAGQNVDSADASYGLDPNGHS
jgi:hypothetical protein